MQLTNRLKKDPELRHTNNAVIRQYYTKGLTGAVVEEDVTDGPMYYTPHQVVIREASDTTRVQVLSTL